jgi:hypothetical protein
MQLPPEQRHEAIEQAAAYTAEHSRVHASQGEISAAIEAKIEYLAKSPFAGESVQTPQMR